MRIVLLRHAETSLNRQNRFQAQADVPLGETGLRQAGAVADTLDPDRWSAVYSSLLTRAVQTAGVIADRLHVPHFRHAELAERNLGEIDGLDRAEFARRHPDTMRRLLTDPSYAPPGGESGDAARIRFSEGLRNVVRAAPGDPDRPPLVVTHGGVLGLLHRELLDTPGQMIGNCRAAELEAITDGAGEIRFRLLSWDVEPRQCEAPAWQRTAPAVLVPRGAA
uniref:Histidine phosphatase family protein n=1 Tax=Streptomyces sp. NBC_00049 TaxID=2903617 RepID=A0AAU2JST6_9ACTN